VDVVWLFCAPLWICNGRVWRLVVNIYSIALEITTKEKDTEVAVIPCNPSDLSKSEMGRGVKHVGKATNVKTWSVARKICHGPSTILSRAPQNPLYIVWVMLITLNGNVRVITVFPTQTLGGISSIRQSTKYGPKTEFAITESTVGSPKGSNRHGDGVLTVGYGDREGSQPITKVGQRMYSTSTLAVKKKFLNGEELLSKMKVRGGKYTGLFDLLTTEEFLFGAYHAIKSKPGNMTPGIGTETLDGFSPKVIKSMIEELKSEKYQFKPTRREFIPKANGKMRPLGIPSPRDKIIQKGMAIILELIYEESFLDYSHGFRPKRGCHTAIHQVNQ